MFRNLCLIAAIAAGSQAAFAQDGYHGAGNAGDGYTAGGVSAIGGFDSRGFGGELYPYDAQYPWLHGYFQEIPAYGGYVSFRPYNWKHVLSQSQAAAGWGLSPTMPYSQQFWHRYQAEATMSPRGGVMPLRSHPIVPSSAHSFGHSR